GGLTTQFVHDAQERVRFVIDPTGAVTEYRYATSGNGVGQQSAVRRYAAAYGGSASLSALESWAAAQGGNGTLTTYDYDLWGRLSQTVAYATVDGWGTGVLDGAASITRFTYDAQGLLRQQVVVHGPNRTLGGAVPPGSQV